MAAGGHEGAHANAVSAGWWNGLGAADLASPVFYRDAGTPKAAPRLVMLDFSAGASVYEHSSLPVFQENQEIEYPCHEQPDLAAHMDVDSWGYGGDGEPHGEGQGGDGDARGEAEYKQDGEGEQDGEGQPRQAPEYASFAAAVVPALHTRSVLPLTGMQSWGTKGSSVLATWWGGEEAAHRFFAEECDRPQGMVVAADSHNGFA
eukprot:gene10317-1865_t